MGGSDRKSHTLNPSIHWVQLCERRDRSSLAAGSESVIMLTSKKRDPKVPLNSEKGQPFSSRAQDLTTTDALLPTPWHFASAPCAS